MNSISEVQRLLHTVKASASPFHTILEGERQLKEAGYLPLNLEDSSWSLEPSKGYYINAYGTTLFAFFINAGFLKDAAFRIAASHTDWPCLRVKPSPEVRSGKYGKLNVEVYGGPILNTWLDRPLSLAGRVAIPGSSPFHLEMRYVDIKRPLLTIPNLAIHMNREVNKGIELNPQTDMLPLLTMTADALENKCYLLSLLAGELDVPAEDILDFELYLYNTEEGCLLGMDEEFISAPRLDNITSVQACLSGLKEGNRETGINLIALFDNEEVGSRTKQGASSSLLANVLERIHMALGILREAHLGAISRSYFLSMDVAHAIHPNKPEKNDITSKVYLNDGIAIKMNSRQAYATDSMAIAVIEGICKKQQIPYKKYANRSDVTGGGTLGSIASAQLAMKAVDVGVPMLAMHSAREMMGAFDQKALVDLTRAFFSEE